MASPQKQMPKKRGNEFVQQQFTILKVEDEPGIVSHMVSCNHCSSFVVHWKVFNATKACDHILKVCTVAPDDVKEGVLAMTQRAKKKHKQTDDKKETFSVFRNSVVCSVKDDGTVFQVKLELPGVRPGDINIELEKETNVLVISGERQSIVGCRKATKFSKRFLLEPTTESDQISAKLNLGILTVTASKQAKKNDTETTKRIPIFLGSS